ncbi:MAG: peptidase S41 [Muribaculaceae bacterium]|nr:peptidase S41 [Muribaculaceae bacterium]
MSKSPFLNSVCFFAVILFVIVPVQCAFAKNDLTPYQKAAIATRFASEVKYNFAGYDKFAQNYDSICRAELPNFVNTHSDEEFSDKLQLFANMLKDGHTCIGFSADVTYAPISHKRIGDKVFVKDVFSDEYTQKGVRRGTEIVAIDDMPVIEYGNKYVVPYIPSSTPQWSATYPFNSVNLTKGNRGVPVKLTFKNGNGKTFDITDNRQSPWGIVNPDMSIKFDSLPGNIGLLRIPSFQVNYFNDQEFLMLYEQKILPTKGLIIDIRDNTGGNSQVGQFIMMLLATDTIPQASWETPKYEAAYASWGKKWERETVASDSIVPFCISYPDEVPKYDKPIILLVNGSTFSAAENFTVLFKNAKRGKVVGTPTGGSTGNPIMIDLGWGYYGRICTRHEKLADGTEFIGVGIQPDVIVEETKSVIFGNGNVIEEAVKYLQIND